MDWGDRTDDPVRERLLASNERPDLDAILTMFPRTTGDPAFDPAEIQASISRLEPHLKIDTGHPFLDLSVETGLAHIDATFQGDHPKYGIKQYGEDMHDGFPPTIIAAVDALSAWGIHTRAAELFRYWLERFVRDDGSIDYYGPSISEYGQLLHTAALLDERAGPSAWWDDGKAALGRLAGYLTRLHREAAPGGGLIAGAPEADERAKVAVYFHNNAWASKGLARWAALCERHGEPESEAQEVAYALADSTLAAIDRAWPADEADWWLTPRIEPLDRPEHLTDTRDASYTNYRYWPELLSSGLLPDGMANRVVDARLSGGGQFCGQTRFMGHLDDWPLADYLYGLWSLGRKDDFLLSLYGHVTYHQAEGHLTAYEQVTFPPGRERAAYCLPCQLVPARAARLLVS